MVLIKLVFNPSKNTFAGFLVDKRKFTRKMK